MSMLNTYYVYSNLSEQFLETLQERKKDIVKKYHSSEVRNMPRKKKKKVRKELSKDYLRVLQLIYLETNYPLGL